MAIKVNSNNQVVTINTTNGIKVIGNICCPIGSMSLVDESCCECTYSFNLTGTVAAGCGGSTYYPNRCTPTSFQTPSITIGPFDYDVEIVSNSILVDDELLVDGAVFQPNQYIVNLGGGCTGGFASTTPQCGDCERFGWNGTAFSPVSSTCNGQHTIPTGTVISALQSGNTVTIAAGDNHGIDLFANGQIKIKAITIP